jgi:hypothetical protein
MLIINKNENSFVGIHRNDDEDVWVELVTVIKWQIAWRRGETEGSVKKQVIYIALPSYACPYTPPCVVL